MEIHVYRLSLNKKDMSIFAFSQRKTIVNFVCTTEPLLHIPDINAQKKNSSLLINCEKKADF